jgi:hypothetical protein
MRRLKTYLMAIDNQGNSEEDEDKKYDDLQQEEEKIR